MNATGDRPRRVWRTVDGIVLLDKPLGMSSNQALQHVRRLYSARKAGHTGALDPLATGVLPLCFGQATKVAGLMLEADKTYRATVKLGTRTATGDAEGEVVDTRAVPVLDRGVVEQALVRFLGPSQQVPPMYSALKRDGEALYKLARRGVEVVREPRAIRIDTIALVDFDGPLLCFDVACSKGTYVRTLGEDLAAALGTTGHLVALRRTDVGGALARLPAHSMDYLESLAADPSRLDALLLPPDTILRDRPEVRLDTAATRALLHGQVVDAVAAPGAAVRLYGDDGRFLGLGEMDLQGARVRPVRLMAGGE